MSIEEQTTDRVPPTGYVLTAPPKDPIIGVVLSVLLFLTMRFGGLPDDFTADDVRIAVEAVAGGASVLFAVIAAVWRRRVKHGNRIR